MSQSDTSVTEVTEATEASDVLSLVFTNPRLLQIALTHSSFGRDHPDQPDSHPSNERFEFLGDAILNFLSAEWLYSQYPDYSEGELSRLRAALVRKTTLAQFARELNLSAFIRVGHTEQKRSGQERERLLADVFEAIVAALYLDQGIEAARDFVVPLLAKEATRVLRENTEMDYRTRLQQIIQSKDGTPPTYRTTSMTGPPHQRQFTVEVLRGDERLGTGMGGSKQAAAQEAARMALKDMDELCTDS